MQALLCLLLILFRWLFRFRGCRLLPGKPMVVAHFTFHLTPPLIRAKTRVLDDF
jgi:hypothetical protein